MRWQFMYIRREHIISDFKVSSEMTFVSVFSCVNCKSVDLLLFRFGLWIWWQYFSSPLIVICNLSIMGFCSPKNKLIFLLSLLKLVFSVTWNYRTVSLWWRAVADGIIIGYKANRASGVLFPRDIIPRFLSEFLRTLRTARFLSR